LQSNALVGRVAELGSLGHFRALEIFVTMICWREVLVIRFFETDGEASLSGPRLRSFERASQRRQLDFIGERRILSLRF